MHAELCTLAHMACAQAAHMHGTSFVSLYLSSFWKSHPHLPPSAGVFGACLLLKQLQVAAADLDRSCPQISAGRVPMGAWEHQFFHKAPCKMVCLRQK